MSGRRYRYNPRTKRVEEIESAPEPEVRVELMTGSFYDGARATDGTDIGARWKRNEYMKQNGLADASDFTEQWKKAQDAKERAAREVMDDRVYATREELEPIRQAVAEAMKRGGKKR